MHDKDNSLNWAHPLVQEWFVSHLGVPTEPQVQGWPAILADKTTLISAPTGSGKTLAAFLVCIDRLIRKSISEQLHDETEVLYISPLKALSNDIEKNLAGPLEGILALARERNSGIKDIRVAVRTGDTLSRERQRILKRPPHILVTTPESFYIMLTAEKSRAILRNIKTVIVDEIHAMANDKRGAHLALSLERLEVLTYSRPVRIGLSATQKPMQLVAKFLAGSHRPLPTIVDIGYARQLDLSIKVPQQELSSITSNEMWDEIYDKIVELALLNRSTLVFVNTRRLAERVAHHLAERLGEDQVMAHHGSLSRKLRLAAETKLKNGELKILVATASLELGIDIGMIDLVCQIGSPRAIAIALQRVGRAGHWHGAISKGRIFATTRDELLECAALIHAIREGDLDHLIMPKEPIDILAQQIVATCTTGDWSEDDLYRLVSGAFAYANLSREIFDSVLEMLAEGVSGSRGRYGAYLFRDRVNGIVKARRGARLVAITSGGAIPANGLFTVIAEPEGVMVGTLDEDFAIESNRGDIILLGTSSWKIQRVESASGRVVVVDAHGAAPNVPFWRGEAPARTIALSLHVSELRQKISTRLASHLAAIGEEEKQKEKTEAVNWLKEQCGLNDSGATQLISYIIEGRAILGAVPSQETVIAERFFDEGGGMQLIIHAPFGARINKAWGLALRKRFCRSFNFELQAAATDDGLNISLAEQHSFPLADVFNFLHPNTIKEVLIQATLQSPLFTTRWRWTATRSLALVRFRNGKKVPPHILRMLGDDLLAAVFPDAAACQDNLGGRDIELPQHPLIDETMKDVLTEALDVDGLIAVITAILSGAIKCLAVDTVTPSPFAHEILNANPYAFLDDAPLEERRARAVEMRRILPEDIAQDIGRLDAMAIADVQQQAWPDIRNADELHDALQTLIAFPVDHPHQTAMWQSYIEQLMISGRVGLASNQQQRFWFATEKAKTFAAIYPAATFHHDLKEIAQKQPARDEAVLTMLRGWMLHLGPTSVPQLSAILTLPSNEVEQSFLQLEATGFILRGNFTVANQVEWCERRLLARIHRLTVETLRKEIAPVTAAQFFDWLLRWQHLAPNMQLKGEQGLLEVIKQLQGFEAPANAWEQQILAKRVEDYEPDLLDKLCLTGVVGWGRLSLHSAMEFDSDANVDTTIAVSALPYDSTKRKKRIMPTSVAPITFFVREDCDWITKPLFLNDEKNLAPLSHVAKNIYVYLKQRGASFFAEIERALKHLPSEIESALWELVAAGIITADGFDNLRALIDKRRRLDKRRRQFSPSFRQGRWTLLHSAEAVDDAQKITATCRMLLKRYGVVFRDLLVREKNIPRWQILLAEFRRLEGRGEIRGGRFVNGFYGEQFALTYAVDSLRAMRKETSLAEEKDMIAAVDPLNLVGIILPGTRVSAFSGNKVVL